LMHAFQGLCRRTPTLKPRDHADGDSIALGELMPAFHTRRLICGITDFN
jgi:hypothetical protein